MKPKSYRTFKGNHCGKCKWVFMRFDWDEDDVFFCTFGDKEERPKCGSSAMKEPVCAWGSDWNEAYNHWWNWADEREVSEFGCCDEFEEEE